METEPYSKLRIKFKDKKDRKKINGQVCKVIGRYVNKCVLYVVLRLYSASLIPIDLGNLIETYIVGSVIVQMIPEYYAFPVP
jgi:hypothetical protein